MKHVIAHLVAALSIAALAGCATPLSSPSTSAETETATEAAPSPKLSLSCENAIDAAVLTSAFTPDIDAVPVSWYSSGDYFELASIGLDQSGALRCEWSDGGSPEAYLQLSVLPEATASWDSLSAELAVYQPRANEFGSTTYSSCSETNGYNSCRVDALVSDRWVSAVLAGLSSVDAAPAVMTAILSSVADADPAESTWPASDTAPVACDSLLLLDQLRSALGVDVEPWANPLPTTGVAHAGFLAAGGTHCAWRNSFSSASAMTVSAAVLPGGAWAWQQHWDRQPHETVSREFVDGLGDDAVSGCAGTVSCWVAVLAGDNWIAITVNDETSPDERDVAITLASVALTGKDTP